MSLAAMAGASQCDATIQASHREIMSYVFRTPDQTYSNRFLHILLQKKKNSSLRRSATKRGLGSIGCKVSLIPITPTRFFRTLPARRVLDGGGVE